MSLPSYTNILSYMSPTITWQGDSPYSAAHKEIFTKALACTVYSRFTAGNILTILCDDSNLQASTNPNESRLFFVTDKAAVPDSIQEVKDIGAYLSDKYKVYQDAAARITIVQLQQSGGGFCGSAFYRRFASAMPRLLPWLFKDYPLTPDELNYFRALSTPDTSSESLARMMEALYNKTDLPSRAVDKAIESLFKGTIDNRKKDLKRRIENLYCDLKETRARISLIFTDITHANCELTGLDSKDESAFITELKDYLRAQKGIIVNSNGESLLLTITTFLSNYDPDDVETFIFNTDRPYQDFTGEQEHDVRILFRAVFIDHIFKIKLAATYRLDYNCHVTAMSSATNMNSVQAVPNPHINHHSCLGNYEPMLEDAEDRRDFITAIAICQQSAGSMNLVETISTKYFFDDFAAAYHNDIPVILTDTGESITPKQAIEQLKSANDSVKEGE